MNAPTIFKTTAQQRIEARYGEPIADLLARLYLDKTQDEIAAEIGASRASVMRWMRKLGLDTRHPRDRRAA